MSTPEPLDEHPAASVEIRGGDRPQDYIGVSSDGTMFRFTPPGDDCDGVTCDCGDQDAE